MEKKLYDLTFWLNLNSDLAKIENKLKELIERDGGEIVLITGAKKKNLAYPLKKEFVAYLETIYFYGSSALVEKLNFELKKIDEILRYLIVRKKTLPKTVANLKEQNQVELKSEIPLLPNES